MKIEIRRIGIRIKTISIFCVFFALVHCMSDSGQNYLPEIKITSSKFSTVQNTTNAIWCVVGTPAGNLPRYNYLPKTRTLSLDTSLHAGWNFLPLPANQAFVIDAFGVDKIPIEMLIIAEQLKIGQVYQVKPLGSLEVSNSKDRKTVLIGIPSDPELQVISPNEFSDFMIEYDPIKYLLQSWYINYKGIGSYDMVKWNNEQFAYSIITQGEKLFQDR